MDQFAFQPTASTTVAQADDKLFDNILHSDKRLLRPPLPAERNKHYSLRHRRHNLQLPIRTSALNNNNFLIRMLFKDSHHTLVSQVQQCNS